MQILQFQLLLLSHWLSANGPCERRHANAHPRLAAAMRDTVYAAFISL